MSKSILAQQKEKKKYSQSKGFKERQSLLSLFCVLYSSWCFIMAWSPVTTYNLLFLCASITHTRLNSSLGPLSSMPPILSQDSPRVPLLLVNVDCKWEGTQRAVKAFLDHVPYKRTSLLMGKDGKERQSLRPAS